MAVISTKIANAIGTHKVFKLWAMPVRQFLKRCLQDLVMLFEGLLRLILYFGSQTAVGHDDQESEFQQEPIISLVIEPYFSIRFKKPGPIKSTKSWKKTSTQRFEQFLIVYLHNPTVFYNLFKNKSKITRYLTICYTKHFQLLNENLDFWRRSQWSSWRSPKDLFREMIQRDLIKF